MSKQELSKSTVDESEAVSTDVVEEINESQSDQSAPEGTEKTDVENKSKDTKPTVNTEDNLELHSLSFRDRQRAKRARIKEHMEGMTKGQRGELSLVWFYSPSVLQFRLRSIRRAVQLLCPTASSIHRSLPQ